MKASLNGPNRRRNRVGDRTVASDLGSSQEQQQHQQQGQGQRQGQSQSQGSSSSSTATFKIKSLETFLDTKQGQRMKIDGGLLMQGGDACIFSVRRGQNDTAATTTIDTTTTTSSRSGTSMTSSRTEVDASVADCNCAGSKLLSQHFSMVDQSSWSPATSASTSTSTSTCMASTQNQIRDRFINSSDPLLLHFHSLPIFILRAVPLVVNDDCGGEDINENDHGGDKDEDEDEDEDDGEENYNTEDILYLSQVHCHNHKICEDSIYEVTCCSRPPQLQQQLLNQHDVESGATTTTPCKIQDYDHLSAIGIEVFFRYTYKSEDESKPSLPEFNATDIAKKLMNHSLFSVLSVNECLVVTIDDMELVCRISRVCVVRNSDDAILADSSAAVCLDEPYRGRVSVNSEFYVEAANPDVIRIIGERKLPAGELPEDAIHVTTNDDEWFPVRRILLAPCLKLTKYVQANRGKYREETHSLSISERSPDAPKDGVHCKIGIDCCTFDRVLLFLIAQMYPDEYKFSLELSEANAMSHAADVLGLQSLTDICDSQASSFASRVRSESYIRFSEVKQRNEHNALLIIIDGMVLDITRWIDEHPGGPSIIPSQALDIDCTCFFEMYHISRQSFLYLKSFYIGELNPADISELSRSDVKASEGFLLSLRSYTDQWRVQIKEIVGNKIHKSL